MTGAALAERYATRTDDALRRAATGEPVVGVIGRDVPAALVAAAGGVPFRIAPEEADVRPAAEVLGGALDRAALLIAAGVLAGRYDGLRGILVARDSEASVRLAAGLAELHRRGRVAVPVVLVDQGHLPRESTVRFNVGRLLAMIDTVEGWCGGAVDEAGLAAAWADRAAVEDLLLRLRDARPAGGGPTGTEALHAYAVAAAAPSPEALTAIGAIAAAGPRAGDALPVWLTGSAPLGDGLYRLLESAGAVVVGEDHDWGDPILTDGPVGMVPQTRAEAAEAVALGRLRGAPASPTSSMAARAAATADGVRRSGARALLAVIREHDDGPAWDWSRQRRAVDVPAVLVRGAAAGDPDAVLGALDELRRSA